MYLKKNKISIILTILLMSFVFQTSLAVLAMDYQEAPMLKEQVEKGDLPPVEERLPENPFIVDDGVLIEEENLDWQSGDYGGTLRGAHIGAGQNSDIYQMSAENFLRAPGLSNDNITGNIVETFEVNDNNTVFTFTLRKGLKWSDGVPVTTEDIRFTYEDVLLNENLTPLFPAKYKAGGKPDGEPMKLEVIDDYTFQITFTEPYGEFIGVLNKRFDNYTTLLKPKHYLKKFHIKYTSLEEMKPLLDEEELEDEWWDLFDIKDLNHWALGRDSVLGCPVLYPWVQVKSASGMFVLERNPYYFKVDAEGKQLPYIDRIKSFKVSDSEMANMKVITGEVDLLREQTSLEKVPLYKENEERGGYKVHFLKMHVAPAAIHLNYTFDDPTWKKVTSDVRFRKALNLAIDREEIIESIYYGFGTPPETIPGEFDPDKARQLLDEMGMDERGDNGFRLSPDGNKFNFIIEIAAHTPDITSTTELVVEYWKEIGLDVSMKTISGELWGVRLNANEIQATNLWIHSPIWGSSGAVIDYLPFWIWSPKWEQWYNTEGEEGFEPPQYIKDLYDAHEEFLKSVPGSEANNKALDRIHNIYYEYIPIFILLENSSYAMITADNMGNIPSGGTAMAAIYSGKQFYFKQD